MINELRFSGLASGIDTESIVKKLMEAERIPLDKMEQQKQRLEWQRDAYREMNALLLELRNLAFDMKLQGTFLAKTASTTSNAFKATPGANAPAGVHAVEVSQLAKGVTAASTEALPDERNADGTIKKLKEQFSNIADIVKFELNGEIIEINTVEMTIYDLVNKINEKSNEKNLGVIASYDATLNRLFLNSKEMGTAAKIRLRDVDPSDPNVPPQSASDSTQQLFGNYLKFDFAADGSADDMLILTGQDAKIKYNGIELTSSTNQITVNGITFDLYSTTNGEQTLVVTNNTDAVFNKIIAFINKYNEVIDKINQKISEPRYRDYPPLTEKQKEELTEKQIELWEEKAKSGILQGDAILSSALAQFRRDFAQAVAGLPGEMDSMFDLGFKTGSYSERGKIIIDESKLREALAKDPAKVMDLFTRSSSDYNEQGIAQRLYNSINKVMKQITDKAGSTSSFSKVDNSFLGRALSRLEEQMDKFEERLKEIEDRYWRQFTAMEKAIQRANMQSAWLMQQFGGGMQ